jgi:PST family polysaccharide transporter
VAFAAAVALEALLTAAGMAFAYRWSGQRLRAWRLSRHRASAMIRCGWPMIFTSLAITIYMRLDQVMLGEMRGDADVGLYAAALRISELWYIIPGAVVSSVAPSIALAKKTNSIHYMQRLQELLNLMAVVGYVIALPITFLAGPIISLLYGSQFQGAAPALAIHIWAGIFVNLGGAHSLWLINEGHTGYFSISTAIGAIINVGLNFLLIPDYGAMGAAIATLVSYGATVAVISLIYKPTRPIGRMILKALLLRR